MTNSTDINDTLTTIARQLCILSLPMELREKQREYFRLCDRTTYLNDKRMALFFSRNKTEGEKEEMADLDKTISELQEEKRALLVQGCVSI